MTVAHLDALRRALDGRGWDLAESRDQAPDEASWTVVRHRDGARVVIDFAYIDDVRWLRLDESYFCWVRGSDRRVLDGGLYFYRISSSQWAPALAHFVAEVDRVPSATPPLSTEPDRL